MCDQSGSVRAADEPAFARRKQPPLQLGIIDLVRDRPAETRHGRPAHVLADRRLADPRRLADKPPAHPQRVRQTQHVTYLPHRHSLRRHRSLPGCQGDRSADSTVDGSDALRRHHLLSAITGLLSALRWNRCPRCTGFRSIEPARLDQVFVEADRSEVRGRHRCCGRIAIATAIWVVIAAFTGA